MSVHRILYPRLLGKLKLTTEKQKTEMFINKKGRIRKTSLIWNLGKAEAPEH